MSDGTMWLIAITVVASLAVATGAGVLARQAATLPIGGQPDGLRAENNVSVENESSNTARFTATDLEESKKQEDQSIDRIELLRLDVELLTAEVNAFRQKIGAINSEMFQVHFRGKVFNESQIEGLQNKWSTAMIELETRALFRADFQPSPFGRPSPRSFNSPGFGVQASRTNPLGPILNSMA